MSMTTFSARLYLATRRYGYVPPHIAQVEAAKLGHDEHQELVQSVKRRIEALFELHKEKQQ